MATDQCFDWLSNLHTGSLPGDNSGLLMVSYRQEGRDGTYNEDAPHHISSCVDDRSCSQSSSGSRSCASSSVQRRWYRCARSLDHSHLDCRPTALHQNHWDAVPSALALDSMSGRFGSSVAGRPRYPERALHVPPHAVGVPSAWEGCSRIVVGVKSDHLPQFWIACACGRSRCRWNLGMRWNGSERLESEESRPARILCWRRH